MSSPALSALPAPQLSVGTASSLNIPLGIHSTLQDLPLYQFTANDQYSIETLKERFCQWPHLPGVVIVGAGHARVLSRQQFLECLLHIGHTDCFQTGLLQLILNQASPQSLILSKDTPILTAAMQALKRSPERQHDPVIVVSPAADTSADEPTYQLLDARTLNVANWQIRGIETQIRYERLQMQLLQSEKMAALGRLVDGVAHEILDPVGFIWGNLTHITTYANQLQSLVEAYESAFSDIPHEIVQLREEIELEYLQGDLPAAINSARSGANRLRQLATSLQNFCHIDEVHPRPTDLNTLIDSSLRLLKSRLTTPINIERCYGKLPPVPCFPGQLSQVFMNIFTNAIDSLLAQAQIDDYESNVSISKKTPEITITTCVRSAQDRPMSSPTEARWIAVIISDNGPGLAPEAKAQILESFSTQSRSRKETGLAMSYRIVTAKHGGKFWLRSLHASEEISAGETLPTTGTEFEILLPLTIGDPQ